MAHGTAILAIDLSVPAHPQVLPDGVNLSVAKNAWSHWALQLDCAQLPAHPVMRLPVLNASVSISAFQVLPAPVNLNDAEYIRQTGDRGDASTVPSALLPLVIKDGAIVLHSIRDPAHPFDPLVHPAHGPVLIWIDLHTTPQTPAGTCTGICQLVDTRGGESAGAVPVSVAVENITLPVEPHLHFTAPLDWDALLAINPDIFSSLTPRLMQRNDPRCTAAIKLMESFIQLAHENKTDLFIPRLQPIVKWPLGKTPEVDWTGFDSIVTPWLNARAFADHVPVGFWPLPAPDSLAGFDLAARCQYWQLAAEHFDQRLWLDRSPVVMQTETDRPVNDAGALLISAEARKVLSSHPRIGVLLPMQEDQVQLESSANSSGIAVGSTSRLSTEAPGLVSPSPIRNWPDNALPPRHWIDARAANAISEQGIRTLAWLAFSRDAGMVQFTNALPPMTESNQPARADQLPLFYPGKWFGTDTPLATLSLKWIRQAEQDYEYLYLSNQHNDRPAAMKMCQFITRPVELQPGQQAEPVFDLLAGSTDSHACEEARRLLVSRLLRQSVSGATDPIELQTMRWFAEHQHPTLVGSKVQWMWNLNPDSTGTVIGNSIDAMVSVDLYNPADSTPLGSNLTWTAGGAGWDIGTDTAGVDVPPLGRYQVRTITNTAHFNLKNINTDSHKPVELRFVDGFNGVTMSCKLMLPVAESHRREQPIKVDGSLDEWFPADAIQFRQSLVKMLDRPTLRSPDLQLADQPTSIFSAWSSDNFYLAFRLAGVTAADLRSTRNFVEYDHGRAWGEDLCEVLIQPIYIDNTTGPTLHIVAKPSGEWVEQQLQSNSHWQPFEAGGVRYASGVDAPEKVWRGELAIPWRAIQSPTHGRPALLRFNFIQHQNSTGQSASWAGPIDQSREGNIAGLVVLKEP